MQGEGGHEAAITEAQGALRDAISALQNLLVLLRSLRAGPRHIGAVLAEIRQNIAATPAALAALLRGLGVEREAPSGALADFLQGCVADTIRALQQAEATSLEARARLALEAEVLRLIPRLDAVRELAELLTLTNAPPTDLDAAELLEATFAPPSRPGLVGPTVQLSVLAPPRGQYTLQANPQAAVRLLRVALGHVHGGPSAAWQLAHASLRTAPSAGGLACVFGERGQARGDVVLVRAPLVIPPTAGVLALFCARDTARVVLSESPPGASLTFPLL